MYSEILSEWITYRRINIMLNKLVKYEFRSAFRQIGSIWAALLAMSVIMGLLGSRFDSSMFMDSKLSDYLFGLVPSLIFIGLLIASGVITVMIVVMRFYKGLLCDEGYLMHTLPVSTGKLVASKGIVSAVVMIVSGIIAFLAIFIIVISSNLTDFKEMFDAILSAIKSEPKSIILIIEICLYSIISIMFEIYSIYTAMAIGQLSGKHRILVSLGAFIGLSTIFSAINTRVVFNFFDSNLFENLVDLQSVLNVGWLGIMGLLLEVVLLHVVTERILSKKLNLL